MKLVICEKPSQAKAYAAVLSANKRQDGFFEGGGYIVSWCYGHLVELAPADAYGEQFRRWNRDVLPIVPGTWQYTASKDKATQLSILRGLMNRADVKSIVCATDAGREGQLIFKLVYDYCKCKKPVERLWISSMEDSAIREGFASLKPDSDYDNLSRAALCRAKADWLVGINATRLLSCLYSSTLAVGRVQSPTLALIVNREADIAGFVKEPFYMPAIDFDSFTASGERLKEKTAAEAIRAACDGGNATVLSVEKQKKTVAAPKLFDLTTLQREANRTFGYTAQQTLDYTQALYEKRCVTYPRTDSRYLTSGMEDGVPALVQIAADILPFELKPGRDIDISVIVNDAGVADHHAIIPTAESAKTDLAAMPAGERNILHMVAARLIAATSPAHVYEAVTAVFECNGHTFTAKGRTTLTDGWRAVETAFSASLKEKPDGGNETDAALPGLSEGQTFNGVTVTIKEGATTPPRRFSEDTLLSAMENAAGEDMPDDAERIRSNPCKHGLGTPATRAAIIEKLIKSGFIERQKRQLVPTQKGINLIAVLPDAVKSPRLTAEWEQMLGAVEKGELSETVFMDGIAAMTRGLVASHAEPMAEYARLFAAAEKVPNVAKRDIYIGACSRCGGGVVDSKSGYFCSNRNCSFAIWRDNRFFAAKKKKLTKPIVAALLKEGRVFFSDLYSQKTGKTYAAAVVLDDTGDRVGFKLDFSERKI